MQIRGFKAFRAVIKAARPDRKRKQQKSMDITLEKINLTVSVKSIMIIKNKFTNELIPEQAMNTEYEILGATYQMKKVMERACTDLMEAYGLRKVELDILYFLAHAGVQNTARDILNSQHISKAHISKSVDNLRQRGFLVLAEDEADHRCLHLRVTDKGMPVVREFEQVRIRLVERLLSGVTEEERACMRNVLKKVMRNLEA